MDSGLCGNGELLTTLREQAENGRMSHAYVIEGQAGSGKSTLAAYIAALCLCEGTGKPCGICNHCKKMAKGIHPDFIIYRPEEGKASISVEQMKGLRQDIWIAPNEAERKVYLVEDAHKLTPQAQNALLKSLEEPPAYVTILLCVPAKDMLLPVILSRAVHLSLSPVSEQEALACLQKKDNGGHTKEQLQLAAELCGGCVGKGLAILQDEAYFSRMEQVMDFMLALAQKDRPGAAKFLNYLEKNKDDVEPLFGVWKELLHDAMMAKTGKPIHIIPYQNKIAALCGSASLKSLMGVYRAIAAAEQKRKSNCNHRLMANVLVQSCWEEIH